MVEEAEIPTKPNKYLSFSFVLIFLFLTFNIIFAWFSPDWVDQLGKILIDQNEGPPEEHIKAEDVQPLKSIKNAKVGNIQISSSIRSVKNQVLKHVADKNNKTKLSCWGETRRGDFVMLKYNKPFQSKSISLSVQGPKQFSALLQTSADGIVYSTAKVIKLGSTNIKLKNEKIKGVRIIVTQKFKGKWTLGDINLN